jgi:outer membrane lipoprotein SlyB
MHTALKVAAVATVLVLAPLVENRAAEAGKAEGVGIGAGVGAIVAGPVGAVVGGVVGYKVGGPNILTGRRYACWRDDNGRRRCVRR